MPIFGCNRPKHKPLYELVSEYNSQVNHHTNYCWFIPPAGESRPCFLTGEYSAPFQLQKNWTLNSIRGNNYYNFHISGHTEEFLSTKSKVWTTLYNKAYQTAPQESITHTWGFLHRLVASLTTLAPKGYRNETLLSGYATDRQLKVFCFLFNSPALHADEHLEIPEDTINWLASIASEYFNDMMVHPWCLVCWERLLVNFFSILKFIVEWNVCGGVVQRALEKS